MLEEDVGGSNIRSEPVETRIVDSSLPTLVTKFSSNHHKFLGDFPEFYRVQLYRSALSMTQLSLTQPITTLALQYLS